VGEFVHDIGGYEIVDGQPSPHLFRLILRQGTEYIAGGRLVAGDAAAHSRVRVARQCLEDIGRSVIAAGRALPDFRIAVAGKNPQPAQLALRHGRRRMQTGGLFRCPHARSDLAHGLPLGWGVETDAGHASTVLRGPASVHIAPRVVQDRILFACCPAGRLPIVDPNSPTTVSSRIITIPNLLSLFRLAMVPVFLVLVMAGEDVFALVILVVSSATDFLDGVLARRLNQITRLGQLLDPAADRLFIFATLIGLASRDIIPWWLVAVIVARDLMLVVLGMILAGHRFGPIPVYHLGKIATACLFYALPLLMVGQAFPAVAWATDPLGWACALWGAFLYWWAGFLYIRQARRMVKIPLVEVGD
jgi:cardiolipin synthase